MKVDDGRERPFRAPACRISRRRFVKGLVAGGAIAGFDLWRWPALHRRCRVEPAVLTGSHFDLVIEETPVNFTGRQRRRDRRQWLGSRAAAALARRRYGNDIRHQPAQGADLDPLARHPVARRYGRRSRPQFSRHRCRRDFVYRIPVQQSGTYWYHSHSRFQEQTGHLRRRSSSSLAARSRFSSTATTWSCSRTGPTRIRRRSSAISNSRATTTTTISVPSALSSPTSRKKGLGATLSDRLSGAR